MAQIIKHRRGSIDSVKATTTRNGEVLIASGSISDLSGPFVFIGSPEATDEGVAGAFKTTSKLYTGTSAPTITAGTYGSILDGTPFYASSNESLYILNNDGVGNQRLDLTGNIEGNTIGSVAITSLTGGTVTVTGTTNLQSSLNVTGNTVMDAITGTSLNIYGNATVTGTTNIESGLNVTGVTSVAGNITSTATITGSTIFGTTITGTTVSGGTIYSAGNVVATGDISGSNLQLTGNANIAGNINLGGNISIGDAATDYVKFDADVSSSFIPDVDNSFDLGSATQGWRDLYISGTAHIETIDAVTISGDTFYGDGSNLTGLVTTLTYHDNTANPAQSLDLSTGTFIVTGTTNEIEVAMLSGADGFIIGLPDDVSIANTLTVVSGATNLQSGLNVTGNTVMDAITGTSLNIYGNSVVTGTSVVQGATTLESTLNVTGATTIDGITQINNSLTVTSTTNLQSGLNVTGNTVMDAITGTSLNIYGNATVTGNTTLGTDSGSTTQMYGTVNVGADSGTTNNLIIDGVSGDLTTIGDISGNNLTASGDTSLLGDLFVSGNLQVLGSATEVTLQSQTVEIDDNIIRLNAYSPFERYAGFEVMDSGSSGVSASLVWDSQLDYWMFVSSSGESSKLIGTSAGTYGSETSLTTNIIPVATGGSEIGDSLLGDNGTTLTYNTNKFTVASSTGNVTIAGNVTVAGVASDGGSNTAEVVFRDSSSNTLGIVSGTESTAVMDGILGYKSSDGTLTFSTVIDGGTY